MDHPTAVTFLDLIREAQCQGSLQVLYVDEAVWRAAENLFRRYHDQGFSFTDCTSIILAQQAKADEIFGFDRHFLVVGFNVKPLW